jgi:fluoride exporter
MILALILAFIGGAIGSICRFWLSGLIAERFGETFPYGTLVVNLVGSWIIGFAAAWLGHLSDIFLASGLKQFIVVGLCGGLTTFSSFSLQTWNLILSGRWSSAFTNIVLSTILSLALVALGWDMGQLLWYPR